MIKHPKMPKPERKRKIKTQNAKKKKARFASYDAKTPEELRRHMEGFLMIAFGVLKVAGIDPAELIEKADEFPSELDLNGHS